MKKNFILSLVGLFAISYSFSAIAGFTLKNSSNQPLKIKYQTKIAYSDLSKEGYPRTKEREVVIAPQGNAEIPRQIESMEVLPQQQ